MRDEIRVFKNWTLPQNFSCFSTKISEKIEKKLPKDLIFLLQKIKEYPLLHKKIGQPLLSIEYFISILIGLFLGKFKLSGK